jgi:hypothetical protein
VTPNGSVLVTEEEETAAALVAQEEKRVLRRRKDDGPEVPFAIENMERMLWSPLTSFQPEMVNPGLITILSILS